MPYKIIESEYKEEVEKDVAVHELQGWKLVGGVSIAVYVYKDPTNYDAETSQRIYVQAMWRKY
jgi:hypothetical protein